MFKERKYIVHVTGVGIAVVLTIYATTCNPLPLDAITKIARQHVNPACEVLSYNIEVPELPQQVTPSVSISPNTISTTGTEVTGFSPSPENPGIS